MFRNIQSLSTFSPSSSVGAINVISGSVVSIFMSKEVVLYSLSTESLTL